MRDVKLKSGWFPLEIWRSVKKKWSDAIGHSQFDYSVGTCAMDTTHAGASEVSKT